MGRLCLLLCVILVPAIARPDAGWTEMAPWLTRAADNARTGWNAQETDLTADQIETRGIARVTIIPVIGDARGMEAQPLILPGVQTSRGVRDVMVLPSMANVIRGVDAHDGSGIWQTSVGTPINGSPEIDAHNINQHWGCLSTGVIDPDTRRLYQVCWVSPDGSGTPKSGRYKMFVINVADGSQAAPPVDIQGSSGGQDFNSQMRKQRASLVETNINGRKTIFGCAGTVFETNAGSSGFCFAVDPASDQLTTMLALTAGRGAGVWMAGQGVIADPAGDLYVLTGNGDFDGKSQWGESLLKLRYAPAAGGKAAALSVVDHWTPWTDLARTGQVAPGPDKLSGMSAPSEEIRQPVNGGMRMSMANAKLLTSMTEQGQPVLLVYPQMATGAWADEDWGSSGPACIFPIRVCIAAGKDGIGYPVKTTSLGATSASDLANPKANCAKLAAPPVWLTVSPGAIDPCPDDPRTLNFFPGGRTAHLHMTPVQFFDPALKSWTIFAWGENGQLRKWAVDASGALSLVAQGHEYASADVRDEGTGGMPGGFCSGASNGAAAGSPILVCAIPYGDANRSVVNGRLLVYDPQRLAPDGSLKVLWDSQRWGVAFLFNKFDPPVIDGGQIYVPNYNGGVDVYQLTPHQGP
jgi:hypothetical protein